MPDVTRITWNGTAYTVDRPGWAGGTVLTLDQIEAWLDTQLYARAADGMHVCVEDLLAQVQAWKAQAHTGAPRP